MEKGGRCRPQDRSKRHRGLGDSTFEKAQPEAEAPVEEASETGDEGDGTLAATLADEGDDFMAALSRALEEAEQRDTGFEGTDETETPSEDASATTATEERD